MGDLMGSKGTVSSTLGGTQLQYLNQILNTFLGGSTGLPGIGETYAPSPIQQGMFDWAQGAMPSLMQSFQGAAPALTAALTGTEMPGVSEAAGRYFGTTVEDPAFTQFEERIMPGMRHAQAVTGTMGTGAAMGARERMGTDLAKGLASAKSQFVFQQQEAARNRALSAIPAMQNLGGFMGQLGGQQYQMENPFLQPHIQGLLGPLFQQTQMPGTESRNIWGK